VAVARGSSVHSRTGRSPTALLRNSSALRHRLAMRFISWHFGQAHLEYVPPGPALWPQLKHVNFFPRRNIGRNSLPSTQYGQRTISCCILSDLLPSRLVLESNPGLPRASRGGTEQSSRSLQGRDLRPKHATLDQARHEREWPNRRREVARWRGVGRCSRVFRERVAFMPRAFDALNQDSLAACERRSEDRQQSSCNSSATG